MKKNTSKKIKIIAGIIFLVIVGLIVYILTRSDIEKKVFSCHKSYAPTWKYDYIRQDGDRKIVISFDLNRSGDLTKRLNSIRSVYESLVRVFFKESDSKYEDYTINVFFADIGEGCSFINIDKNCKSIEFYSNMNFSLKDITNVFPDVCLIDLDSCCYNDISEIKGFTNLKYVHFGDGITYEEKNIFYHFIQIVKLMHKGMMIDDPG